MSELSFVEETKLMLLPFEGQHWYHQLLIVASGVIVWLAMFAVTISVIGDWRIATTDSGAGLALRRRAAIVAGFVATTYYMIIWISTYGGLVLSLVIYPLVTSLMMVSLVPRIFGTPYSPFIAGEYPSRFAHIEFLPIAVGAVSPIGLLLVSVLLYLYQSENSDEIFVNFLKRLPDVQVRVFFPIQPSMSPELKRVIREAHRSSTDGQNDDDARANS